MLAGTTFREVRFYADGEWSSTRHQSPACADPGGNPRTGVAGQVRFEYLGKPTELIGSGIVAMLLLMVTCGLAYPWIIAGAQRYYYSRIRIHTDSGVLTPEFTGTGFLCFVEVFLSSILVMLTLGIYALVSCQRAALFHEQQPSRGQRRLRATVWITAAKAASCSSRCS